MARNTVWRSILVLTAAASLAGCVETAGTSGGTTSGGTGAGAKVRAGEEIEAPDVFQTSESALWDGRPSLGGIWVASPEAVDPERVVMFNPATGKSVKGALFRRERDNPGPRLQLSSDAAEALGVLAGMPTEITVTALRKAEVVEEVVAPVAAPEEGAEAEAPGEPAASDANADAASVAAAALDAVDAGAGTAADAAAAADPAAAVVEEEPKRKTWKEKRAEAKAEREAKRAAEAAAKAAAEGIVPEVDEAPVTPDAVAGDEIEAAPLDVRKPDVAEETTEAAKPEAVAVEVAPASEPAAAATGGPARTIQIGSFSKEDNANRAVDALSKIGIAARTTKVEKDGKIIWGVVASGDEALLKKIKDAGFADAYFLK